MSSEKNELRRRLEAVIEKAFPVTNLPREGELFSPEFVISGVFKAEELRWLLSCRSWKALPRSEIEQHPAWLIYLTPTAFVYYLPAWLTYTLDSMEVGFPAQFIVGYLVDPPLEFRNALSEVHRLTIRTWYDFLRLASPVEKIPPTPDYLLPRG